MCGAWSTHRPTGSRRELETHRADGLLPGADVLPEGAVSGDKRMELETPSEGLRDAMDTHSGLCVKCSRHLPSLLHILGAARVD